MYPQPSPAGKRSDRLPIEASRKTTSRLDEAAFTLPELAVVLTVLALLGALALPVLANSQNRSQQLVCLNNLAQIGRALATWGADHRDRLPLTTPWWEGGTVHPAGEAPPPNTTPPVWFTAGLYNNAWFHFSWVSNELASPKVLACPADPDKRQASDFSGAPSGGFLNGRFQNAALTYTINHPSLQSGRALLSTERSASYDASAAGSACSYRYSFNRTFSGGGGVARTWSDRIHPRSGNVLFSDGAVEQTDDRGLTDAVSNGNGDDQGQPHYLSP